MWSALPRCGSRVCVALWNRCEDGWTSVAKVEVNTSSVPPGLSSCSITLSSFLSGRTARMLTASADPTRAACRTNSSKRTASTCVLLKLSWRTTSRRKAAFLVRDSTISIEIVGHMSFIGTAGEPPPEPTSITRPVADDKYLAAKQGSRISRSIDSSVASAIGKAVSDTRSFHFRRRSKYFSRPADVVSVSAKPNCAARLAIRCPIPEDNCLRTRDVRREDCHSGGSYARYPHRLSQSLWTDLT